MCGQVGVFGDISVRERKMMFSLLFFDMFRGWDSTGLAFISKPFTKDKVSDVEVFKSVGTPMQLFGEHNIISQAGEFNRYNNLAILGHNRAATWGDVNKDNAHPFQIGEITGTHNGTLKESSLKELPFFKEYAVDSQIMFRAFDEYPIEEAYKKIDGAIATVWWDAEEQCLNILRNTQRPLYCCFTSDNKTFFYASEGWMLRAAFDKHNASMNPSGVMVFEPHMLYTPYIKDSGCVGLHQEKLVPFVQPAAVTRPLKGKRGWDYTAVGTAGGTKENNQPRPLLDDSDKSYETLEVEKSLDFANGFGNFILTKKMFELHTKKGCDICQGPISWDDKNKIHWTSMQTPVCFGCIDAAEVIRKGGKK